MKCDFIGNETIIKLQTASVNICVKICVNICVNICGKILTKMRKIGSGFQWNEFIVMSLVVMSDFLKCF